MNETMIRNQLKIFTLMLLTASCSSEQPDNGCPTLPEVSAKTLLGVRSLSTGESAATRLAGTAKALDNSAVVGFYVQALNVSDKAYYSAQNNVKGTYDATDTWKPATAEPIWLNNRTAQLAVYTPYSNAQNAAPDGSADGILSLTAALRSTDGANDLCAGRFAANNQSMAAPGISATLEHLYARVVFTFIKYANYTEAATIDKIEWNGKDIYKAATYDLFGTGTGIADISTSGISASAYAFVRTDANRNLTFTFAPGLVVGTDKTDVSAARADLLLVPTHADFEEDGILTVTASTQTQLAGGKISETKVMSVPIPKSLFAGDRRLGAGKQFNITVRLSVADLVIEEDEVKLTEWEDTDVSDIESKLD